MILFRKSMNMFIDIHTYNPSEDKDVLSITNINVPDYICCCGIDLNKTFSIGIHPWKIKEDLLASHIQYIEQNAQYDCVKAIGECGLDKLSDADWDLQIKAFKNQIIISEKLRKPMIIHCVKAFDELLQIKRELNPEQKWIIHGFRGKPQQMHQLVDHGLYFSIGLLFNNETVKQIPLDRLFLETDDKEVSIKTIYKEVSPIKEIEDENLISQIEKNFAEIF